MSIQGSPSLPLHRLFPTPTHTSVQLDPSPAVPLPHLVHGSLPRGPKCRMYHLTFFQMPRNCLSRTTRRRPSAGHGSFSTRYPLLLSLSPLSSA
uniref:Uncharacterized protein n=1 Tax=Arundo donax TaxID=35708 RepID=A0A0A9F4C3_ARUDO